MKPYYNARRLHVPNQWQPHPVARIHIDRAVWAGGGIGVIHSSHIAAIIGKWHCLINKCSFLKDGDATWFVDPYENLRLDRSGYDCTVFVLTGVGL